MFTTFVTRIFTLAAIFSFALSLSSASKAQSATPPPTPKAPFVLITDVDDTIKVSQILDPVGKVIRFLADPVAFAGMSTLYHQLIDGANRDGRDHGFAIVSGTPWVIGWSVWEFLEEFSFPEASIVAMRPIGVETLDFKSDEISKILDQDALDGGQIVLIGDDTEADHEAYLAAKRQVADPRKMNTEIFIRRVSGRAANQGDTFAFDSAADIAVVQFLRGRLSEADVEKVFREIEAESDLENLFVPGEYCPDFQQGRLSDDKRIANAPRLMLERLTAVENHLRRVCSGSSSWFAANRPKMIQLSPRVRNAL